MKGGHAELIITRLDKGRAVVVMLRSRFLEEIDVILSDTSKFARLGPCSQFNKTEAIESK